MRSFDREDNQLRPIKITAGVSRNAEGSCLIECGYTKVLCTASVEEHVPRFLKGKGRGWVTAEYGMLPRSTGTRNQREAARGKQTGRTVEIQRLIGRSLRAVISLEDLGERQILIDCDVLEADGGTRTASITGAYVALQMAINKLMESKKLRKNPMISGLAAVSCGIVGGKAVLDLDYEEDYAAQVDANFIMTSDGNLVEIQATGEEHSFSEEEFMAMMKFAKKGIKELSELQTEALK